MMNLSLFRVLFIVIFPFIFSSKVFAQDSSKPEKKSFIWKIKSPRSTSYLLGSIHVAKPNIYPLDDKIEKAFEASDTLVVEVNPEESQSLGVASQMMLKAMYPENDSLENHISKEVLDQTESRFQKYGAMMLPLRKLKPWFIATTMAIFELQAAGIVPDNGIDLHFLRQAKGKKTIQELESAELQISLLDSFSDKEQEIFLKYTQKDLDQLKSHMDEIINLWISGDENKLEQFLTPPLDEPELRVIHQKLFENRNKKMAAKIEELLKTDQSYFMIVGAGHLIGENGLLKILSKNYELSRL